MISPLLLVFLLQLTIHIINTIGKQTINDAAWHLYTLLPTTHSTTARELLTLRTDLLRLNREITATSAQDEFSKWAKLRRQQDKLQSRYDALSRSQSSFHSTFHTAISTLRFLGTQGLNFACNFYYSKQAMFWLPRGWVPWQVEWILSFPRAPVGGVSINVWGIACACVVGLVSEGVVGWWSLGSGRVKEDNGRKGEKVKMEGMGMGGEKSKGGKVGEKVSEKKEL